MDEQQRRLLPPQVVQAFTEPPEEQRGGEFLIAEGTSVSVQSIHRLYRDQQRYYENHRYGEEAHNEPRSQGHFRGALVCESFH
jgi:hypothetical protein